MYFIYSWHTSRNEFMAYFMYGIIQNTQIASTQNDKPVFKRFKSESSNVLNQSPFNCDVSFV